MTAGLQQFYPKQRDGYNSFNPKLRDCWLVQAGEYIKSEETAADKQSDETASTSYAASGSERSQSSEAKRRAVKVLLTAPVHIDMQKKSLI